MNDDQARYARLAKISQLINSNLDLHSLLEAVASAISDEIVQCDSTGIYLPQSDGTFRGYVGKPDIINGITLNQMIVDPQTDHLARDIIETRKSIYIPDTSMDTRPDPKPVELFKIRSLLGLPISYGDELFGIVFLFDYGIPMNLSESEIQTVEAYVNMAGVAIHNVKQFQAIQSLLREKQLLLDVTSELSLCSTTEKILDTCFRYVGRVLDNTNIGVHLCDSIGSTFRPAKLSGNSEWTEEQWRKTHSKIKLDYERDLLFQEVIRTKKYVFIPDVDKDHRPNHEACHKFGIRGVFMLPLVATGEVLGTIAVVSLGEIRTYTEHDMLLAQSIVDVTATALSNAIQLEQLELIINDRTKELRENHRILELILNSAGEGVYGLNLEGEITFCNPAAARMLELSVDELIGKKHTELIWSEEGMVDGGFEESLFDIFGNNTVKYVQEVMFRKKDELSFPVEYVLTPIVEDEAIQGGVVIFSDISERKSTEEIIRKTDKLSVIGELAAGVAHEIRNPLTTLRGFIQLLNSNPNAKQENLEIMLSELDRINFIVSELLFIAKPQCISLQKNDLREILEHVVKLLQSQAIMNNVEIDLLIEGPIPNISCAESQLKQAFINIVKNSIESMENGGLLQIRVELEDDHVEICFKDQGSGLSKERIPKLGEPFYTTKEKGVGLGLMVTFQIIKYHHGRIHVESAEGVGTTVEIELPLVLSGGKVEHLPYTYSMI
ncbi:GAF domain-containing protein [Paenibacillus radicis (ex Xue et al. 2023)]|uniref:histidine kinase n=1 Tax=Paenibacillus radicis (ex Xue et al. 2023) TaxID=2972489 RepID=A0ABT1Y972_9BACL|nr:GAF domain-containing protein [Paenibacillus radicis (ex Xue et al. 2023)]MCR8629741.1 GAF domain-containing protein [Paenibacillus radicis (ex Xue et al. 2023)]